MVYFIERSETGLPGISINRRQDNVVVITPSFPVDYRIRYRTPLLNEFYHYWLLNKLKGLNVDFDLVITFDHTSHIINQFFDNVIYYCGDDFIGNAVYTLPLVNYYHRLIEQKLAASSGMCVVTSEFLLKRHVRYNEQSHLIPLGAPTINYERIFKKSNKHTPVLGIVAFFDFRIPLEILDQLLQEFKIYMIGPADQQIQNRYQHNRNAIFTGTKRGKELYQLIEDEVDVCIAPYAEDKINKGLTPNKLWLYLALGKPCVVTNIPNIKEWNFGEKIMYKCSNQDFIQSCRTAFLENNETLFKRRIQIANENSWHNRVDSMLNLYYNVKALQAEELVYQ